MTEMSEMGKHIFSTLTLANEAAKIHIQLGREQMALAVMQCWKDCANPSDALDAIIVLCREEAKK